MTSPIASRVDDPSRSWESNNDEDSTCKTGPLAPEAGVHGPHAEAHAQDGDLYAGAFLLRGRDPESGLEVELFSASIHQGELERGVQAGMARMGGSTDDGHFGARGEVFTAHVKAGTDNQDGSVGFGASMGATIVGGEITGTLGPVSLTVGASIGATVGASLGVRDGDADGKGRVRGLRAGHRRRVDGACRPDQHVEPVDPLRGDDACASLHSQ